MNNIELKTIALNMAEKGYTDYDVIRYSDDLYNATDEEIDKCLAFVSDIIENGVSVFRNELNKG